MLSVIMLSIVMLRVVRYADCRYAECHYAECLGALHSFTRHTALNFFGRGSNYKDG
jgi:hypothetical protein